MTAGPAPPSFDRQPVLVGELVELRPLRADDLPALSVIASDHLVWEQHPSKERAQPEVFRLWFDETLASGGALAIIDRRDGRVIGTSRFDRHQPSRDEVEIGWTLLARSHWGGAYNGEAKQLMIRHAARHVGNVVFRVHALNLRSQRAVQKLGAARIGSEADERGRGETYVFRLGLDPPASG